MEEDHLLKGRAYTEFERCIRIQNAVVVRRDTPSLLVLNPQTSNPSRSFPDDKGQQMFYKDDAEQYVAQLISPSRVVLCDGSYDVALLEPRDSWVASLGEKTKCEACNDTAAATSSP